MMGAAYTADRYFYPRPPRGGRLPGFTSSDLPGLFLSTPSARRATVDGDLMRADKMISIHALREEGDLLNYRKAFRTSQFLSTPSARRATRTPILKFRSRTNFYPRPPRGGRHSASLSVVDESFTFLSTPSARRATNVSIRGLFFVKFLSTPSARRATFLGASFFLAYFISIHALREEGDIPAFPLFTVGNISIHALREEGDGSCARILRHIRHFYPRPPRGGRHESATVTFKAKEFLSTPSARRATRNHHAPEAAEGISIHALREEGDGQL